MRAYIQRRVGRAVLLAGALGTIAGCGGDDFENKPRPAVAKVLTGVIQEDGVSVQPTKEGAGAFRITISNQTGEAHTVTLEGTSVEERVGPIQPQDTGTIQKTLPPGDYEVRAGSEQAVEKEIPPAKISVGPPRPSSGDQLLLP